MCSCSLKLFLLVLILSIAFWIVKFLDCYEPTWANLSQLEPTCGPKWPNGAAHAHAYCIIRAGNGNCWASVSATINLYFKHVTCSQDTFKMASSTQTRKIHVPIGLWIFMVIIVRTAGSKWRCDSWYMIWPQVPRSKTATIAPEDSSSDESYSFYSLSLEAPHLCFYVLLDQSVSTQFHSFTQMRVHYGLQLAHTSEATI